MLEVRGKLYGTTWSGGTFGSSKTSRVCPHLGAPPVCGTVFSVTTSGAEKVLHSFGNGEDAQHPGLAYSLGTGTTLDGTTFFGGTHRATCAGHDGVGCEMVFCGGTGDEGVGCGTVFSITTSGIEKVLHNFGKGHEGRYPQARLLPVHGALYGTTKEGGSDASQGTVFVITTDGVENILYRFATQGGSSDPASPAAGLTNVKGTLYGTSYYGGSCQEGTVYSVTTAGVEKVLHGFCNGINDGSTPWAGTTRTHTAALARMPAAIAARLAQTFRESLVNKGAPPHTLAAKSGNKRRNVPGAERSPLLATPRKASQPRPYATRAWRTPTVEARPANPNACAMCGEPVLKRRRRHCEVCMPIARREHGLRAIEAARKVLAAQTKAGHDPRRSADVNGARGEAIGEGHRRNLAGRASIRASVTRRGSSA